MWFYSVAASTSVHMQPHPTTTTTAVLHVQLSLCFSQQQILVYRCRLFSKETFKTASSSRGWRLSWTLALHSSPHVSAANVCHDHCALHTAVMSLSSIWGMLMSSGVTLLLLCLQGELQRAHLHAAAAVWGPRVPRAARQGRQVPQLAGADVLRGRLLRVLLLHHRAPHRQAFQPAAGGDLRAGPAERERLPLAVWAGQSTNQSRVSMHRDFKGEVEPAWLMVRECD